MPCPQECAIARIRQEFRGCLNERCNREGRQCPEENITKDIVIPTQFVVSTSREKQANGLQAAGAETAAAAAARRGRGARQQKRSSNTTSAVPASSQKPSSGAGGACGLMTKVVQRCSHAGGKTRTQGRRHV